MLCLNEFKEADVFKDLSCLFHIHTVLKYIEATQRELEKEQRK